MTEQHVKRHPIRGFFYGIVFGLGLLLLAVGQGWAALGTLPPFILLIVGIIIGTLWGLFAPAKKPKGEPPRQPVHVEAAESSRFDDFTDTDLTAPAPDADSVDAPATDVAATADEVASGANKAEPSEAGQPPSSDED